MKNKAKIKPYQTMTTKKSSWEDEFSKRFIVFTDPDIVDGFKKDEIISFIRQELSSLLDRVEEEIIVPIVRKDVSWKMVSNANRRYMKRMLAKLRKKLG